MSQNVLVELSDALADAAEHIEHFFSVRAGILDAIGGQQRQAQRPGQFDQRPIAKFFLAAAVVGRDNSSSCRRASSAQRSATRWWS